MDHQNYYAYEGICLDFNEQKIWGIKDGNKHPLIGKSKLEFKRQRQNKGPKILHSSNNAAGDVYFSSNHQLLEFDHLIAIDTNTNRIGNSTVSITAAYHLIPRSRSSDQVMLNGQILAVVEFWNIKEKPENFGWWQILQSIELNRNFYQGKIVLIVDSDLGNHDAFNKRELPVFGDFFLPKDISIIYGSDKGGSEHLSTKMIKYCHNLASDLYKEKNLMIEVGGIQKFDGVECTHYRQWDLDKFKYREFAEECK